MRHPRLKAPPHALGGAFYHCLSRVVDKQFLFGPNEKDRFLLLLRECERFSRVRVLSFAILDNHFHLLLHVPHRPPAHLLPSPDQIVRDLHALSGHQFPLAVQHHFQLLRQSPDPSAFLRYLASFHARMFDLSAFMKLLKQRFTQWFNASHQRKGTLWEERFKSVLVDPSGPSLATLAAYIDLNPVRAGIVSDPKDYPWCSYALALAGSKSAKSAIHFLVSVLRQSHEASPARALETYRQHLFLSGDIRHESIRPDGTPARGALAADAVANVLRAKGKLPLAEYLKCRVRYFCDGAIFGGREFVETMFKAHRQRFGPKRRSGARPLRGLADLPLFTVRDFRLRVFGAPGS